MGSDQFLELVSETLTSLRPDAEVCRCVGVAQGLDPQALDLVVGVGDVSLHVVDVRLWDPCADQPGREILAQRVDPDLVHSAASLLVEPSSLVRVADYHPDPLGCDGPWRCGAARSDQRRVVSEHFWFPGPVGVEGPALPAFKVEAEIVDCFT